ncbi:MAG: hypothetical protein A3E78_04915 [Alphaproteobacteria bacterium RIFCSPHIGHO2_12_FULL_63_12]|nr:MAG: hypothetical protein A3E78_04915 [Alphaproteobacteria bacterium RIFCSPHIGHO2_12_FULL_63_12]
MQPVRADQACKGGVPRDKEQDIAGGAERAITPRHRLAPRIVIIAIDDGGAGGQGAHDGLGVWKAAPVGQEGQRKRRAYAAACAFEHQGGGC